MRTFAEQLSEYMTRTGVSDAELARTIGVRRQTIFRWKEGLVAHPRSAEEVLRCATKLRLTPEERDRLLLAAGFPPEAPLASPPTDLQLATAVKPPPQPAGSSEPACRCRHADRARREYANAGGSTAGARLHPDPVASC